MKQLSLAIACALLWSGTPLADDKITERLAESANVFGEIMAASDKAIRRDLAGESVGSERSSVAIARVFVLGSEAVNWRLLAVQNSQASSAL